MKLLVVVDAQKDFIDGALRNEEAIKRVPNICEEVKNWDGKILFTKDTHFVNTYMKSQEGRNLPVEHCIRETDGWQINEDIVKAYKDSHDGQEPEVIEKYTFGLYDWIHPLLKYLLNFEDETVKEIELIGYCTDICVVSNAMVLKALLPEVTIKVKENCCAGVTPEKHQAALEVMRSCQIQII